MAEYTTIDPWVISADTPAEMDFLTNAFGAVPRGEPVLQPDGTVGHAEVAIGDSVLLLFDAPRTRPAYLRIYVDDIRATYASATAAGARVVTEPLEMFWGDITGRLRDPQGHLWWVFQKQELDPGRDRGAVEGSEVRRGDGRSAVLSCGGVRTGWRLATTPGVRTTTGTRTIPAGSTHAP